MKRREFVTSNVYLALVVTTTAFLVFGIFSNYSILSLITQKINSQREEQSGADYAIESCNSKSPIKIESTNAYLSKLSEYQSACNSYVTNKLMIFTSFPSNASQAQDMGMKMAATLKEFNQNGISPIVIIEPYVDNGPLSYTDYLGGRLDLYINSYFATIKNEGVTADMAGIWVPFPEPNTPNWDNKNAEPRDFALSVNKYLTVYKNHFPSGKGSVLLSAITFESNDIEWANGDYLNLVPYLQDIDRNLVDSFGIQGFPWVSDATTKKRQIFRASEFLQPDLAVTAAQELRTKDIWINTGSFAEKYTDDEKRKVSVSLNERKGILNGILDVAKGIQSYQLNEYRVSINLFAEDKSGTKEATDWSYFQSEENKEIMKEFFRKAEEKDIAVSLYDKN